MCMFITISCIIIGKRLNINRINLDNNISTEKSFVNYKLSITYTEETNENPIKSFIKNDPEKCN